MLTLRRTHISSSNNRELYNRVMESVFHWVSNNPGKQIPNMAIADQFKIRAQQVNTVTKHLVQKGAIEKASPHTYKVTDATVRQKVKPEPIMQAPLPLQVIPPKQHYYTVDGIVALAREFHWEHDSGNLKDFVSWLQERKDR